MIRGLPIPLAGFDQSTAWIFSAFLQATSLASSRCPSVSSPSLRRNRTWRGPSAMPKIELAARSRHPSSTQHALHHAALAGPSAVSLSVEAQQTLRVASTNVVNRPRQLHAACPCRGRRACICALTTQSPAPEAARPAVRGLLRRSSRKPPRGMATPYFLKQALRLVFVDVHRASKSALSPPCPTVLFNGIPALGLDPSLSQTHAGRLNPELAAAWTPAQGRGDNRRRSLVVRYASLDRQQKRSVKAGRPCAPTGTWLPAPRRGSRWSRRRPECHGHTGNREACSSSTSPASDATATGLWTPSQVAGRGPGRAGRPRSREVSARLLRRHAAGARRVRRRP